MDEGPRRGRFWQGVAAFVGGAALLAGGALAGVMLARPKKPGPPMPVWQRVTGDPATGTIAIPASSSFAIAVPATDPTLSALATQLGGAGVTGLMATQPGTAAPQGFPADGLGSAAYRATAVAGAPLVLTVSQSTQVWLYAGVAPS